jgi:[acyl-carrier-protein] S-malonyltransferase
MFAVVFPGQGSQKPGMGKDLFDTCGAARAVFEEVARASGIDIAKLCFEADDDTLRQTQNAQLALYTCGVAAWRVLAEKLPSSSPAYMAGHSIGEYAALACCGIVSVEDGARLVRKRGEVMAESGRVRPGGMAAILGLERGALEEVCKAASTGSEVVVIANDNCPGQMVISGDKEAVGRACGLATEKGAKRALPLNVSGAFHSPLMEEPAKAMREVLAQTTFKASAGPVVVGNVSAQPVTDASQWSTLLEEQLRRPVRWNESVQAMLAAGVTTFVECGGGEVLSGLIKRIDKEAVCLKVADGASAAEALG